MFQQLLAEAETDAGRSPSDESDFPLHVHVGRRFDSVCLNTVSSYECPCAIAKTLKIQRGREIGERMRTVPTAPLSDRGVA